MLFKKNGISMTSRICSAKYVQQIPIAANVVLEKYHITNART